MAFNVVSGVIKYYKNINKILHFCCYTIPSDLELRKLNVKTLKGELKIGTNNKNNVA